MIRLHVASEIATEVERIGRETMVESE